MNGVTIEGWSVLLRKTPKPHLQIKEGSVSRGKISVDKFTENGILSLPSGLQSLIRKSQKNGCLYDKLVDKVDEWLE